jgi:hypothetical protein
MEMRLLKAVALLREPTSKVINVAEQCGFNHLGLFNTCFKRRFGASPGEWRKTSPSLTQQPPSPITLDPTCRLRATGLCPWSNDAPRMTEPLDKSNRESKCHPAAPCSNVKQLGIGNKNVRQSASKNVPKPAVSSGLPAALGI